MAAVDRHACAVDVVALVRALVVQRELHDGAGYECAASGSSRLLAVDVREWAWRLESMIA